MAILRLKYGGQTIAQATVTFDTTGSLIKFGLSANNSELAQVGHIWRNAAANQIGSGTGTVNSSVDQELQITLQAETVDEFKENTDFLTLRSLVLEWLRTGEILGSVVYFSQLEVQETAAFVAFAELEVEVSNLTIAFAELEIQESGSIIAKAELQVGEAVVENSLAIIHEAAKKINQNTIVLWESESDQVSVESSTIGIYEASKTVFSSLVERYEVRYTIGITEDGQIVFIPRGIDSIGRKIVAPGQLEDGTRYFT